MTVKIIRKQLEGITDEMLEAGLNYSLACHAAGSSPMISHMRQAMEVARMECDIVEIEVSHKNHYDLTIEYLHDDKDPSDIGFIAFNCPDLEDDERVTIACEELRPLAQALLELADQLEGK